MVCPEGQLDFIAPGGNRFEAVVGGAIGSQESHRRHRYHRRPSASRTSRWSSGRTSAASVPTSS